MQPLPSEYGTPLPQSLLPPISSVPGQLPPVTSLQPQSEQPRVSEKLSYNGSRAFRYSAGHDGSGCPSGITRMTQSAVT